MTTQVACEPFFPDAVNNEGETWWVRLDLAHRATDIVSGYYLERGYHLERMGRNVMVPGPGDCGGIGHLYVADLNDDPDPQEAAVYVRFEEVECDLEWFDDGDRAVCRDCKAEL